MQADEDYIEYCENSDFGDNTIERKLFYDDFMKALKMCKNLLPHRQLEIFEMSRENGKTIEEIAVGLRITEQTVKNQLTSAMKTLRTELTKYNLL